MTIISFRIEYVTRWAEEVAIAIEGKARPLRMESEDGKNWHLEMKMRGKAQTISYHYQILSQDRIIRQEWHLQERTLSLGKEGPDILEVRDDWRLPPKDLPFYTSAFLGVLFQGPRPGRERTGGDDLQIRLTLSCPPGYRVRMTGNQAQIGSWNPRKAMELDGRSFPLWSTSLVSSSVRFPLFYKFLLEAPDGQIIWEEGEDRCIPDMPGDGGLLRTHNDALFRGPEFRCAGCAVPLFSLRSEGSFGVGDMGDLRLMTGWMQQAGLRILQLLPINDTTQTYSWTDSYPYRSISIYAIHPMYMDLRQLPPLQSADRNQHYKELQARLNQQDRVNYEGVNRMKREYLEEAFAEQGERDMGTEEYGRFIRDNASWIGPYSAFCMLRDLYGSADFRTWPQFSLYSGDTMEKISRTGKARESMAFHSWVQFHLDAQLRKASEEARTRGIVLKGDIPIGISRDSVEAWTEPEYFNFQGQAGAPPDDFSPDGQNWGFPTYNWDAMEKDGFRWWKARLRKMSEFFGAFRIDHVLGFFRIWEIPSDCVTGLLGHFEPALGLSQEKIQSYGFRMSQAALIPEFTMEEAREILDGKCLMAQKTFLESPDGGQRWRFRPEFNSQTAIRAYYSTRNAHEAEVALPRLYAMLSDVLFLRDTRDPALYHPRIEGQKTMAYRRLTPGQKHAYDLLYQDYFFSNQEPLWRSSALRKLPELESSTPMLCCAEDLGMIPACVPEVLRRLQILTLEIERMPKTPGLEFALPKDAPYQSVGTFSTHDMSTIRGWWQQERVQASEYYKHVLFKDTWHGIPGDAGDQLCRDIVAHTLNGRSMLAIMAIQDILAMDQATRGTLPAAQERINIPSNPRHYWRYRMPVTIEQLRKTRSLTDAIREILQESHRS